MRFVYLAPHVCEPRFKVGRTGNTPAAWFNKADVLDCGRALCLELETARAAVCVEGLLQRYAELLGFCWERQAEQPTAGEWFRQEGWDSLLAFVETHKATLNLKFTTVVRGAPPPKPARPRPAERSFGVQLLSAVSQLSFRERDLINGLLMARRQFGIDSLLLHRRRLRKLMEWDETLPQTAREIAAGLRDLPRCYVNLPHSPRKSHPVDVLYVEGASTHTGVLIQVVLDPQQVDEYLAVAASQDAEALRRGEQTWERLSAIADEPVKWAPRLVPQTVTPVLGSLPASLRRRLKRAVRTLDAPAPIEEGRIKVVMPAVPNEPLFVVRELHNFSKALQAAWPHETTWIDVPAADEFDFLVEFTPNLLPVLRNLPA